MHHSRHQLTVSLNHGGNEKRLSFAGVIFLLWAGLLTPGLHEAATFDPEEGQS